VPSYPWLLTLLKLVKPEPLNRLFTKWVKTILPESIKDPRAFFTLSRIIKGKLQIYPITQE
jgi:hypothetical protein